MGPRQQLVPLVFDVKQSCNCCSLPMGTVNCACRSFFNKIGSLFCVQLKVNLFRSYISTIIL
jgi:hypothetical protein